MASRVYTCRRAWRLQERVQRPRLEFTPMPLQGLGSQVCCRAAELGESCMRKCCLKLRCKQRSFMQMSVDALDSVWTKGAAFWCGGCENHRYHAQVDANQEPIHHHSVWVQTAGSVYRLPLQNLQLPEYLHVSVSVECFILTERGRKKTRAWTPKCVASSRDDLNSSVFTLVLLRAAAGVTQCLQ
jgi:hypothetical protein